MTYAPREDFVCTRITIFNGCALFVMPDNWVFSLEAIRELLSIRIDPEHHTCQESKGIVQARLSEVEARIKELQTMRRSLQRLNDACCGTAHSSVYCSILEALEQGASNGNGGR
ncbi:zinc-responsive transcriptional regulator [Klebsiella pneumoniae]|nr:zinc-responsive transcriptional regulator [Klebsiella pneumoniae]